MAVLGVGIMKKLLITIHASTYSIARPKLTSLYLFTIAAIMSTPPELPLLKKQNASPNPVNIEPTIHDSSCLSGPRMTDASGWTLNTIWNSCRNNVSIKMAYIVFIQNLSPNCHIAMIIRTRFMEKYEYCIGIPVVYCIMAHIPVTPPVTNVYGAMKKFHAKA